MQRPLDALLLKASAANDSFPAEISADRIAARLADWSSGLLRSPQDLREIEKDLAADFSGCSLRAAESRVLRSGALEIRQNKFAAQTGLARDVFLQELRASFDVFSNLLTAEFQLTGIEAAASQVATRVRYEFVGAGREVYREQRVGYWDLTWEAAAADEFRLRSWRVLEETQSRTAAPVFIDIAAQAIGGNASFAAQLQHGTDYWRTVLDGACGIDVYGHNGVSVGDIDGDGFDDLYVCQPAGLPNRLYKNRGDGTFEDITGWSGVGVLDNTACALLVDVDNDGLQDLIVVRAGGPLLFLNQGGGKFRLRPDAFRFASPPQGTFTAAAVADYDRDGWLDIYFCLYVYYQGTDQYKYPIPYFDAENGPPNFLMRNNRDGTFRDVTAESGLNRNNTRYSFSCGWSDYNRDGWPDLYVVNDFGRKNLYRNNGDGTFTDVAPQTGVEDVGAGMSVCWFDYNNDGSDDLYVANMWTAAGERVASQESFQKDAPEPVRGFYRKHAMGNSLFRNQGGDPLASGSAGHSSLATEGAEVRMGKPDSPPGSNGFQDATAAAGVGMGRWAWSSDAWDFDHDGFADLYIANGMVSGPAREDLNSFFWRQVVANSPNDAKPSHAYEQGWNAINELIRADGSWSGYERNVFYANNRDGTFSDVSGAVGMDFPEDGRSFALADFDHDGRQEVFLKNRNAPVMRILKNILGELPPAIAFRLRGTKSSRDAIGAAVTIETDAGRQTRFVQAGSGFLSQHSKEVFFGLGASQGPVRASIRWPSGLVQELHDLPPNHRVWVEEGADQVRTEAFRASPQGPSHHPLSPPHAKADRSSGAGEAQVSSEPERLPTTVETWLLSPVAAPDFSLPDLTGQARTLAALHGKPVLLSFWSKESASCQEVLKSFAKFERQWTAKGLQLLTVNADDSLDAEPLRALARKCGFSFPILRGSDDVAGIYNIVYRYLFDRHRDLPLPASFLIDEQGDIVKVYQGTLNPDQVEHDFQHIPRSAADRLTRALPFPGVTDVTEFPRNYLSYGSGFFQRGYFDQAQAAFRVALRDDPASAEALYGVGSVYLERQKNAEARASFERVTKLHPTYPDTLPNAWNNLGLLAAREGRAADAIPYFQEALRLSPDHLIALDNLGNAYRQLKQWDEARHTLERAVAVGPDDPEANYSLGMVFAQTSDAERAYEYLTRALKLRPAYPEALNNLGILYLRTQRRNEAVASFEESIRVAPAFDQAYLNLARVYALEGDREKARALLVELLKQHPGHPQAQTMMKELER